MSIQAYLSDFEVYYEGSSTCCVRLKHPINGIHHTENMSDTDKGNYINHTDTDTVTNMNTDTDNLVADIGHNLNISDLNNPVLNANTDIRISDADTHDTLVKETINVQLFHDAYQELIKANDRPVVLPIFLLKIQIIDPSFIFVASGRYTFRKFIEVLFIYYMFIFICKFSCIKGYLSVDKKVCLYIYISYLIFLCMLYTYTGLFE
jgi:hypothetical protein